MLLYIEIKKAHTAKLSFESSKFYAFTHLDNLKNLVIHRGLPRH